MMGHNKMNEEEESKGGRPDRASCFKHMKKNFTSVTHTML